jgi:hypothetical protein
MRKVSELGSGLPRKIIIIIIITTTTAAAAAAAAVVLSPSGSSPTLVQTKIKIHKITTKQ